VVLPSAEEFKGGFKFKGVKVGVEETGEDAKGQVTAPQTIAHLEIGTGVLYS
jgi:hypothetical protein